MQFRWRAMAGVRSTNAPLSVMFKRYGKRWHCKREFAYQRRAYWEGIMRTAGPANAARSEDKP